MADIAFRPGVIVRKTAAKKTAIKRKHRGDHQGAIKVIGQTAAVAGLSGALLLALKAMVELLIEKGYFTREEYLAKLKRSGA